MCATHETAKELGVHPEARRADGGSDVVDARLQEEHDAKEVLAALDGMEVTDPAFTERFAELRHAVLAHAEAEEHEEFPLLRSTTDDRTRERMAAAVRAAESMAPTRPHPGVESQTANLAAGPPAALGGRTPGRGRRTRRPASGLTDPQPGRDSTHQTALPCSVGRVPHRSARAATICSPRPCSSFSSGRSLRGW